MALASILIPSAIGVCIPLLIPEKDVFFIIKTFSGVILYTGFIHVFPDAFENLTFSYMFRGDFPFTGFVAM